MSRPDLVDRLAALPSLAAIPREELEWLVARGRLEVLREGVQFVHKGQPIGSLWIVVSGHLAIWMDRGTGRRRVMDWRAGDVSGVLPFSRMTEAPGDAHAEEVTELLEIDRAHFTEMAHRCPAFTGHTVHAMLDRARSFNTHDLQDEKMIALGKLAAGLAHELNNPASATVRGAKMLAASLDEADAAARALGAAGLSDQLGDAVARVRSQCVTAPAAVLSPLDLSDREDEIARWLERHGADPAAATALAETAVTIDQLDSLAEAATGETLDASLRWIASGCVVHSLAVTVEQAATRIFELVDAVKRFTYVDNLAGPERADVEAGWRDTLRIAASKARSKHVTIALDVEADLPRVQATGGELNQVWLNLLDNALDAVPDSGRVDISARRELDRVVVRVVDNGPGIPPAVMPFIFDPFFTTKPPGHGTGLGLEISRRILARFHAEISVHSRPGRTEFRVSLAPDVQAPASTA